MSNIAVSKYIVNEPFTILDELFLEGDELYIQTPMSSGFLGPRVFNSCSKKYIGRIDTETYQQVIKKVRKN